MLHLLDRGTPDATITDTLDPVAASEVDLLAGRTARWSEAGPRVPHAVAARALVLAGRPREARSELALAAPIAEWSDRELASGVWALSRVGRPTDIAAAASVLEGVGADRRPFLFHGDVPLGQTAMFEGLLAAASGDLESGAARLREAARQGDERAPAWGARARHELVRILHDIGADDETRVRAECSAMRTTARMFYVSAGYTHQRMLLDDLGSNDDCSIATPARGMLVPGSPWHVGFGVQPAVSVSASKGLRAIRYLIEHRDRRVPAVEIDAALHRDGVERLRALREEIMRGADGGGDGDLRGILVDDKVRTRVSKLLRRTVDRLEVGHARLARHLRASIETGHSCAYVAGDHVRWIVDDGRGDT